MFAAVNWPFAGKKFLAALHPTGVFMTAPPLGMEEDPLHAQGHPAGPMMSQFAMGPNGPFPPYRMQHQVGHGKRTSLEDTDTDRIIVSGWFPSTR